MLRQLTQLAAFLVLPALACGAGAAVLPEDCFPQLRALFDAAEGSSPAMEQQAGIVAETNALADAVRSQRMPRVSGYARVQSQYETRINSQVEIDAFNVGPNAGLTLAIPIFHWGEFPARAEYARARGETARLRMSQRLLEIRQELRRNFVQYQLSLQAAAIAADGIEFAQKKQDGLKGLVNDGLAPRQDLVEADIFAQERQEELDYSENQSAYCLGAIRLASGVESIEIARADFPELQLLADSELESLRLAATAAKLPAIGALEAELAAEEASTREIRSRNRPKIDAVAAGGVDAVDEYRQDGRYATVPRAIGWVGVQATWTIYDGGDLSAQEAASLARVHRLRAALEEARLRQQHDVGSIARDATLNASRYRTRLQRLELLRRTLAYMEEQLAGGGVSANDYFQRRLDFQRTQLDLLNASATYMLDIAQLNDIASCSPGK